MFRTFAATSPNNYVTSDYERIYGRPFDTSSIAIARIDLNTPSDGLPEYIIHVAAGGFCGTGGCAYDVVRIAASGKTTVLASILAFAARLASTSSNGMRDLITTGRGGEALWRFNGKSYVAAGRPKKCVSAAGASGRGQARRSPPDRHFAVRAAGAKKAGRETPSAFAGGSVALPSSGRVQALSLNWRWNAIGDADMSRYNSTSAAPASRPEPRSQSRSLLTDVRISEMPSRETFSELAGYAPPILKLPASDPLFEALIRGSSGSVRAGVNRYGLNLKGSRRAIVRMLSACDL